FLGLGLMGGAMARVLLADGFAVRGYDPRPERVAALAEAGLTPAASPADAASGADVLCRSLPDGASLRDAHLGSGGTLAYLASGAILVDFTPGEPAATQALHAAATARGVDVGDAPVSGGPPDIPARQLVILVGAEDAAYAKAEPVLTALSGGRIQRTGGVG